MRRALLIGCLLGGCDVPGGALEGTLDAAGMDAGAVFDAGLDAGPRDAGPDAEGTDADPFDGGSPDAFDASFDGGVDAPVDVGVDAPVDASFDAGCTTDDACNGVDDDCDGFIDEDGCEGCTRVEAAGVPGHVYLFCDDAKRDWDEGVAWCAGLGYRLADVQTELEHSFVWMRAQSVRDDHWWIGLRDVDGWEWTRGEVAHPSEMTAYNGWMSGDPSDAEECARMKKDADAVDATFSDGGWETKSCTTGNYVICELGG